MAISPYRNAARASAVATMAAVSARRIVSPNDAAVHPDSRNHRNSSSVQPPSGPTARTASDAEDGRTSRRLIFVSDSARTMRGAGVSAAGLPVSASDAGETPALPSSLSLIGTFVLDECADLALALHNHAQRHRLHAARGEAPPHLIPEQRRNLVAHQPVEHAAHLLRVHQVLVHLPGVLEGQIDSLLGDLVEHHAENLGDALFVLQFFLEVVADGFAFAVRIGREIDFIHILGGGFQFGDELLLALDN